MTKIRFDSETALNVPNINDLNNVVINSTEPTTGEEVWIQKGKNLLSGIIEGYTLDGNGGTTAYDGAYITNFVEVQPNTSYVASGFTNTYKEWYDENFSKISNVSDNPAISPSNAKYLRMNGTGNTDNLQIEEGSTATAYEPYVSKKIHTKNDNGVYEEFYNEEEHNKVNYSTTEQVIGTWIDGKTLYRKVYDCGKLANASSVETSTGLTNVNYLKWDAIAIGYSSWPYQVTKDTTIADDKIKITCNGDLSNYTGYVTILYTKN